MKNNRLKLIMMVILILLLIPLVAMQFTEEVNWSFGDFIVMAGLLTFLGGGIEFFFRRVQSHKQRIIFSLGALFLFFLIWAEMAVGVFGSPFAGS